MMQQVNLLTAELMPRQEPLTVKQLGLIWLGFTGLLLLATTWSGFDIWRLTADEDAVRAQWQTLRDANEQLRASFSTTPDPQLEEAVAALRIEQAERAALMSLLADYHQGQASGFSGYLRDLSTHSVDGMWLSEISLHGGGRWIGLKGVATDPARVPEFLRALADGESFDGHLFDGFELRETESGLLEFALEGPEEPG
jgi:hypothetical protein